MNSRCPSCPNNYHCIPADGPTNATVMCIAERPGQHEEANAKRDYSKYGWMRCLVGPTGDEWNKLYLPLAGLDRGDVRTMNAVRCGAPQNRKPSEELIGSCAGWFIPDELRNVDPRVVVLMGATACRLAGEIDLESEHGIPREGRLFDWEGWIIPMYHPAAGLHDTSWMQTLMEDWERLGPWLEKGEWNWPEDGKVRDYRHVKTVNELDNYFLRYKRQQGFGLFNRESYDDPIHWAGVDSETHAGQKWSIQASLRVGTGIMITADNAKFDGRLLHALHYWMNEREWCLHNASADLWVAQELGIEDFRYRDTMQEAYQFQNLPQKLKALSRRLLGRKRSSWEETVTPPSREVLAQWMMNGHAYATTMWTETIERVSDKTGKKLKSKIVKSEAEKKLDHLLKHMRENVDYPADMTLWEKVKEMMPVEEMKGLVDVLGPMPQRGIGHCELAGAVYYGCSDADDTLALALLFEKMRKGMVEVNEEDWDR